MTVYTILWLVWAAMFAIVEGVALANKTPGDTLSEHVWALFRTRRTDFGKTVTGTTRLRRFTLLAGLAWLVAHFLTGGLF